MKKVIFLPVFLIFIVSQSYAQSSEDFIGSWEMTVNIVMGIESKFPAVLVVKENGTYAKANEETGLNGKEINKYVGIWEITEDGLLKLIPQDEEITRVTKSEYWNLFKSKDEIGFYYAELPNGEIFTAKEMIRVTVYERIDR